MHEGKRVLTRWSTWRSNNDCMARTCIFCGRRADSRQHLWARRIGNKLQRPGGWWVRHQDTDGSAREWPLAKLDVWSRIVCQETCNGGWMSQIEDAAWRLVDAMMDGQRVELTPEDQGKVASWAMLVSIVAARAELAPESPVYAERACAEFYRTRLPLPNTAIWLNHTNLSRTTYAAGHHFLSVEPPRLLWRLGLLGTSVDQGVVACNHPAGHDGNGGVSGAPAGPQRAQRVEDRAQRGCAARGRRPLARRGALTRRAPSSPRAGGRPPRARPAGPSRARRAAGGG